VGLRNLMIQIARVAAWEVAGLSRPLFILLLSVVFSFYIPSSFVGHPMMEIKDQLDLYSIAARDLSESIANAGVVKFYVPLILIISFSVMNTFTREFDSGLAKFYLSLPVSKLAVISGKLLGSFLTIYSVEILVSLLYAYLLEPSNFLNYFLRLDSAITLLSRLFCELFFIFGVTTYICILAPKSWVAIVLSTFSLYSFLLVNELQPSLKWYLPPQVFCAGEWPLQFFGILFISISILLMLWSFYAFVRRLEVT